MLSNYSNFGAFSVRSALNVDHTMNAVTRAQFSRKDRMFFFQFLSSEAELLHLGFVSLSVHLSVKNVKNCQKSNKACKKKCQNMSYKIGKSVNLSICQSVG